MAIAQGIALLISLCSEAVAPHNSRGPVVIVVYANDTLQEQCTAIPTGCSVNGALQPSLVPHCLQNTMSLRLPSQLCTTNHNILCIPSIPAKMINSGFWATPSSPQHPFSLLRAPVQPSLPPLALILMAHEDQTLKCLLPGSFL